MADSHPVRFDLTTGQVNAGGDDRVVMIPLAALDELAQTAGVAAASRFARSVGMGIGRRLARRLDGGALGASLEAFVSGLALEVAVSGWGALSIERWGKAMVIVVEHAPAKEPSIVAALVEGSIAVAAGREVHGVALAGASPARVLVTGRDAAERARRWTTEGVVAAEVIARLHQGGPSGAERSGA